MKRYLYILIGIGLAYAGTAWGLPFYQQTQSLIPGQDNKYNIGTSSPTQLWYKEIFSHNLTSASTTLSGIGGGLLYGNNAGNISATTSPTIGWLYATSSTPSVFVGNVSVSSLTEQVPTLLKLDQSTPQTVTGGDPGFDSGIHISPTTELQDNDIYLIFYGVDVGAYPGPFRIWWSAPGVGGDEKLHFDKGSDTEPPIPTDLNFGSVTSRATATSTFSGGLDSETKIFSQYFVASSTSATSTLPRLTSTGINTSWLCLSGTCNSAWPASASSTLLSDNNNFTGQNWIASSSIGMLNVGWIFGTSTATSTFKGDVVVKNLEIPETGYASSSIYLVGNKRAVWRNISSATNSWFMGNSGKVGGATGSQNNGMGDQALASINNAAASWNNAMGANSLYSLTSGASNNAMGFGSLFAVTNGYENTAVGSNAFSKITGAADNVGIGYYAGRNSTAGNGNIVIGAQVDLPSLTASSQLNIGNVIYGTGMYWDSAEVISSTSTPWGRIGISSTTPGAKFSITGFSGTTTPLFMISTSTASATTTVFKVDSNGFIISTASTTPASATATCERGTTTWDADYIYVCIDTNTWKRAQLATW